jgi:hypothetical protein
MNGEIKAAQPGCTLQDLYCLQDLHELWSVDAGGDPVAMLEKSRGLRRYRCKRCQDTFYRWQEAMQHLPGGPAGGAV